MGALAQGGVWFGGSTRNPWNTERSSSGSSAGPGAATAAGLVGFSIGTETLGSIISPSVTNGVTGLRPTYGRVSRYGAMALSWTMDKIGPMCRSVEDCVLVLNAIYGSDGKDDTVHRCAVRLELAASQPLASLRIGYIQKEFEAARPNNPQADRGAARRRGRARSAMYAEALDVFRKAGAKLEPMAMPDFPNQAIGFVLSAEAAAAFDDLTRNRGTARVADRSISRATGRTPSAARASFRRWNTSARCARGGC